MHSKSAAYFKQLAKISADVKYLASIEYRDISRAQHLIEQKAELERIYGLIATSAKQGGIRTFLPHTDPVWDNCFILQELSYQGFSVNKEHHSSEGAIEWLA